MNLGSMAGGFARGYNDHERLLLAKKEQEDNRGFRERQMKIVEEDQNFQRLERERRDKINTETQQLFKDTFGDDPSGVSDTFKKSRFLVGKIAIGMKHSMDAGELLKLSEAVQSQAQQEQSQMALQAIAGNKEAQQRLFQTLKLDPSRTNIVNEKGQYFLTDGATKTDITLALSGMGAMLAAKSLQDVQKGNLDRAETESKLAVDTARVRAYDAAAGLNVGKTENLKKKGAGGGGVNPKDSKAILAAISKVANPKTADGRKDEEGLTAAAAIAGALHRKAGGKMTPEEAAVAGVGAMRDIQRETRQWAASLPPEQLKAKMAKAGTKSVDEFVSAASRARIAAEYGSN